MNKIFKILPKDEKRNFYIFSIFVLLVMIFETASVGMVYPLIMAILSENFKSEKIYSIIQSYTGDINHQELIIFLLIFVSLIFVLKNIFLIYLQWWKHGFTNRVQFKIQKKLIEIYLFQPFLDVIKKNTAIKVRNISTEVSRFSKYFISILTLLIEGMIVVSISILLFYLNPKVAIIILIVVSTLTLIFYFAAKLKAENWSKDRIRNSQFSMKILLESLSSIKELKIFKKEDLFIQKYSFYEKRFRY